MRYVSSGLGHGNEVFGERELHEEAIKSFKAIQGTGAPPPTHVLLAALKACGCLKDLHSGIQIHSYIVQSRRQLKILVWNSLMCMYAKCGRIPEARSVLREMPEVDVVSWNSIMFGCIQSGEPQVALELFSEMQQAGFRPDALSFVAALKACSCAVNEDEEGEKLSWLRKGLGIHSQVSCSAHHSSTTVANSLLHLYVRCGGMSEAKRVFDKMKGHDVVSWTALISGFADAETRQGAEMALELFSRMQLTGDLKPNRVTLVAAFKACASGGDAEPTMKWSWLEKGMAIHSLALELGFQFFNCDLNLNNSLLSMYAKCGSLWDARWVFEKMTVRSAVSWTAIIFGYVDCGEPELAITLFNRMLDEGISPDAQTFVAALKACASAASKLREDDDEARGLFLERTFAIHAEVVRSCNLIVENNLVQAYAKCGSIRDAREVFERMRKRSLVSWNTMLNAYADAGEGELALELLLRMRKADLQPDAATFAGALKACGSRGDLERGRGIHGEIKAAGLESNNLLQTCLVDMYGKCGSMSEAQQVFDSISEKDLVAWSALAGGYSLQGDVEGVLRKFESMKEVNEVVLLHLLAACSHAGVVEEGKRLFDAMVSRFSIAPGLKHYSCLVDLLARANRLSEALEVVKMMPVKPDATIWTSILSAARKWGNDAVARVAFQALVELEGTEASSYVLFAGIS